MQSIEPLPISAVIICKDEAACIADAISSLKDFSEVLIFDNGSTDGTQAICKRFANVTLEQGEFKGFGPTKAHAVNLARNDWVLSIDADECVSQDLVRSLRRWDFTNALSVGEILRENVMMGRVVKYGGWGKDYLVRLFNRTQFNFDNAQVHEGVNWEGAKKLRVSGVISHQAVTDIGQMLKKIDHYSDLRMVEGKEKLLPFPLIIAKSVFAFVRFYLFYFGFVEGWRGFVIAYCQSIGVFFKYAKPYTREKTKHKPK